MGNLIDRWKTDVNLLKIDIEGAEQAVFGASSGQGLSHVRNIAIELHGDTCEKVFLMPWLPTDSDKNEAASLLSVRISALKTHLYPTVTISTANVAGNPNADLSRDHRWTREAPGTATR